MMFYTSILQTVFCEMVTYILRKKKKKGGGSHDRKLFHEQIDLKNNQLNKGKKFSFLQNIQSFMGQSAL